MKPLVYIDLTDGTYVFRGQFVVSSDPPTFELILSRYTSSNLLSQGGVLVNSDRILELCQLLSQDFDLRLTERAVERMKIVRNESEPEIKSLHLPFPTKAFQRRAFNALDGETSAMIVASPGTGKTLMGTMKAVAELDRRTIDRVVVFCPSTLVKKEWVPWLESVTDYKVGTVNKNQPPAKRQAWYNVDDSDIWVLNYDRSGTGDWSYIINRLKGEKVLFVFDEVQKLKNRKNDRHKKFMKLIKEVKPVLRIGLSATPLERGPEDYFNEWLVLDKTIFKTVKFFEENFTLFNGEKDNWGTNYLGYKNLDSMGLMTAPQVFTIDKKSPEIAKEFPEKLEVAIDIELSREERIVYDKIMQLYWKYREYDKKNRADSTQRGLFTLMAQRLCRMPEVLLREDKWTYSGSVYDYEKQLSEIKEIVLESKDKLIDSKHSAKLERTKELVEDIVGSGEKLVIFGVHTNDCLYPLAHHLRAYNPLLYTGDTSDADKVSVMEEFKNSSDRNLILMSDAGKEGLNLQECTYLLHYDTPFTYSAYNQRSDRIHRLSSVAPQVTIYRFITRDTYEERIEDTVWGRKELSDQLGIGEYEAVGENDIMNDIDFLLG